MARAEENSQPQPQHKHAHHGTTQWHMLQISAGLGSSKCSVQSVQHSMREEPWHKPTQNVQHERPTPKGNLRASALQGCERGLRIAKPHCRLPHVLSASCQLRVAKIAVTVRATKE